MNVIKKIFLTVEKIGSYDAYVPFSFPRFGFLTNRNFVQKHLQKVGISTAIHYPVPLPFMEAYNYLNHSFDEFPEIFSVHKKILSLPMFPELSLEQIEYVVKNLNSSVGEIESSL